MHYELEFGKCDNKHFSTHTHPLSLSGCSRCSGTRKNVRHTFFAVIARQRQPRRHSRPSSSRFLLNAHCQRETGQQQKNVIRFKFSLDRFCRKFLRRLIVAATFPFIFHIFLGHTGTHTPCLSVGSRHRCQPPVVFSVCVAWRTHHQANVCATAKIVLRERSLLHI